jgi:hypothetical protein
MLRSLSHVQNGEVADMFGVDFQTRAKLVAKNLNSINIGTQPFYSSLKNGLTDIPSQINSRYQIPNASPPPPPNPKTQPKPHLPIHLTTSQLPPSPLPLNRGSTIAAPNTAPNQNTNSVTATVVQNSLHHFFFSACCLALAAASRSISCLPCNIISHSAINIT